MLKILTGLVLCAMLLACKKSTSGPEPAPPPVPVATIQDATQARLTSDAIMRFTVTLSKAATTAATIDYTVADGTAKAPKDYTATSGTLTIPVAKSQGTIEIPIKGDATSNRENNLEFVLQLSNARGCALGMVSAKGIIITE